MKLALILTLVFVSLSANARGPEDTLYSCTAGDKVNDLNIQTMVMTVSNEHPDAEIMVSFANGKVSKGDMAFEGDSREFLLTPYGAGDGSLTVWAVHKHGGSYEALVAHETFNSHSILNCTEQGSNQ